MSHSTLMHACHSVGGARADAQFGRDLEAARPMLTGYARRLTRDADRACDLTQETLLRAWKHRARFVPGTNLKAWLTTILRNLFVSSIRRLQREVSLDCDAAIQLPMQEMHVAIRELTIAWRHLSAQQRKLLSSVAIEGQSYEDVASAERLALGTVKSRVARARHLLRQYLERPPLPTPVEIAPCRIRNAEDEEQIAVLRARRARRAAALV